MSHRNPGVLGVWGDKGTRVVAAESYWKQPLAWDKAAREAGERRRVFCASLADVFEGRDELIAPRRRLAKLIWETQSLDWLFLTKRPENAERMIYEMWADDAEWPKNYWLGTSVEDQRRADERIPALLEVPAAVRFLSVEPLLGPVDLARWIRPNLICCACEEIYGLDEAVPDPEGHRHGADECAKCGREGNMISVWGDNAAEAYASGERNPDGTSIGSDGSGIDWMIVGGESGPKARTCNLAWIRSIRDQCKAAGVSCFVKQIGSNVHGYWLDPNAPGDGICYHSQDGGWKLRDSKGGDESEWPHDLRGIREFPR